MQTISQTLLNQNSLNNILLTFEIRTLIFRTCQQVFRILRMVSSLTCSFWVLFWCCSLCKTFPSQPCPLAWKLPARMGLITLLYSTRLYFTLLFCTLLYFTGLYSSQLYSTLLQCTVPVLQCSVLYYAVLHFTLLAAAYVVEAAQQHYPFS